MKLCRSIFFVLTIATFAGSIAVGQSRSHVWSSGFEAAQQEASETGVNLLVHFYADWCGPCRSMERDVLGQPDVRKALKSGIVAVKINSDQRRDLVKRFGITSLPTDVFVSSDGKVLARHVGSPGKTRYIARLNQHRTHPAPPAADVPQLANESLPPKPPESDPSVAVRPAPEVTTAANTVVVPETDQTPRAAAVESTQQNSTAPPVAGSRTKALVRDMDQRIGLSGYCPVSLSNGSGWKRGAAMYTDTFEGVTYRFHSDQQLTEFKANPRKFVPALHGYDAVLFYRDQKVQAGAIELGARYQNRVYFFASASNRDEFIANPRSYAKAPELKFFTTSHSTSNDR